MNGPGAVSAAFDHWAAALWAPVSAGSEPLPCPPGLQCWNGASPARRFAVHRNTVWTACIDALGHSFPAAQRLLGESQFAAMARGWLQQQSPRSAVLSDLGAGLADWLDTMTLPPDCPWLPDLLRLEWLRHRAFNAADAPALGPEQLMPCLANPAGLQGARPSLHASLALMRSTQGVLDRWQQALELAEGAVPGPSGPAHPRESPSEPPGRNQHAFPQGPATEYLLVLRHNAATGLHPPDTVLALSLAPTTWRCVQALHAGQALGAAWLQAQAGSAALTDSTDPTDPQQGLAETLGLLIRHGAITAWHSPVSETP